MFSALSRCVDSSVTVARMKRKVLVSCAQFEDELQKGGMSVVEVAPIAKRLGTQGVEYGHRAAGLKSPTGTLAGSTACGIIVPPAGAGVVESGNPKIGARCSYSSVR